MKMLRYALILFCLHGTAHAEMPALTVVATDPAINAGANTTLAQRERFYVEVELPNAGAVTIEPYYQGAPITDGIATSAAAMLPADGGRGVVSFFYWGDQPALADEIHLNITTQAGITTSYALPVHLTLSTQDASQQTTTPRTRADWVTLWEQNHALPAPVQNTPNETFVTIVGTLIAVILVALFSIVRFIRRKRSS